MQRSALVVSLAFVALLPFSPPAHRRSIQADASSAGAVALVGNNRLESGAGAARAGQATAYRFVAHRSGRARKIHLFLGRGTRASKLFVAVYSNASGHPGRILSSGVLRHPHSNAWNAVGIRTVSLKAGKTYWLAILATGGSVSVRGASRGSCSRAIEHQHGLSGLPSRWSGASKGRGCPTLYVAGTPSARHGHKPPPHHVPPPPTLKCTSTIGPGSNVAGAVDRASAGSVICLQSGSYPELDLSRSFHPNYVTLAGAPGASAVVHGVIATGVSYLRFEHLLFDSGIRLGGDGTRDIQIIGDDIGNSCFGVGIGDSSPVNQVLIQGVSFHNIHESNCGGGGAYAGQGVTINWGYGVTVAGSSFRDIGQHYIQGCGNPTTITGNLFGGPGNPDPGAHLNVWQIWSGGSGCSFTNNVVQPGAADPIALIFENGPGGDGSARMSNITVANNLFDQAATQEPWQIGSINGLTVTGNTVVGSHYGTVIQPEGGLSGSGYNITHNISVDATDGSAFNVGGCSSSCTFDYNVSSDGSAAQMGARHYVTNWRVRWINPTWFLPVGLPFGAGFIHSGFIPASFLP